ncbi:MAG TPA: DUF2461 domain-containing protein [Clostridia bacterium]|nr:DUF2461 domain-containing protein [Clostridia bacterium]
MDNGIFTGFTPQTLQFLMELQFNNNKAWFEENKQRYLNEVAEPFKMLVKELAPFMLEIDQGLETRAEIGKTISRIYRDTRFSKEKTPYKTSVWITFRRVGRDWLYDPSFFFEITPDVYRYGMGFYTASKPTLERLRELIDDEDPGFMELKNTYENQKLFVMEGDRYKKLYAGMKSEDLLEWYQRKNVYFMCTKKPDKLLFSPDLTSAVKDCFTGLVPFYRFLWRIKSEGEAKEQTNR